MLLDKMEDVLTEAAKNKLAHTLCVWGKHGIGKTQGIESVAKKLRYGIRNFRLSQVDSTDLIGFPRIKTRKVWQWVPKMVPNMVQNEKGELVQEQDDEGNVFMVEAVNDKNETVMVRKLVDQEYMDYVPPVWWVDAMAGNYVIFLDEINRAKPDCQQAVFELIQERRMNGRKLPDTVLIVAACNPDGGEYTTNAMDLALMDRFIHMHVHSNFEVFQTWGRGKKESGKHKIAPEILSYLSADQTGQIFDHITDRENPFAEAAKPSPRSWEKATDVFYMKSLSEDLRRELIAGIVGEEIAVGFFNSLRDHNKPVTLDEIIEWSPETVAKIKMYAMLDDEDGTQRVSVENGEKRVEMSLIKNTCNEIAHPSNGDKAVENANHIMDFFNMISADMAQAALKDLLGANQKKHRKFWETKIYELAVDAKGKNIPLPKPVIDEDGKTREYRYRWENLVSGLVELHYARQAIHKMQK